MIFCELIFFSLSITLYYLPLMLVNKVDHPLIGLLYVGLPWFAGYLITVWSSS